MRLLRRTGFVVFEIGFGTFDVLLLRFLASPEQEDNDHLAKPGKIDPITRPPIYRQFHHAFAYRLDIAEISDRNAGKPRLNPRACLLVSQALQPLNERLLTISALVD